MAKAPKKCEECARIREELAAIREESNDLNTKLLRAEDDAEFWKVRIDEWRQRCAVLEWMLEKTLAIVTNTRQPEFPHAEFRDEF